MTKLTNQLKKNPGLGDRLFYLGFGVTITAFALGGSQNNVNSWKPYFIFGCGGVVVGSLINYVKNRKSK